MGHPAIAALGLRIRPGRKEPLHRVGMAVEGRQMKRTPTSVGGLLSGFSWVWFSGLVGGQLSFGRSFFKLLFSFSGGFLFATINTTHKIIRHGLHMHTLSLSNKNNHEA